MTAGSMIAARFELERLVGSGGMGDVYCARDKSTGAQVAVKQLHGRRAIDVARFEREAEVLAELHHPNIVRYVAHGTGDGGRPYLAMEWLSGEDLGTRLSRMALTLDETITLMRCAAEALAAVHQRGIIHRDLK